ncbi:hypothetical protein [Hominenteromicrobium sp.]|uniref:hypothetical protein n=1 Tax=Hominenteromicrobium sp. TaxID=3073581 RepID=UPI003AB7CE3E
MTNNIITAVGIDVSKGKSMIAIRHGTRVERFCVFTARNGPNNKNLKQSPQHTLFFG